MSGHENVFRQREIQSALTDFKAALDDQYEAVVDADALDGWFGSNFPSELPAAPDEEPPIGCGLALSLSYQLSIGTDPAAAYARAHSDLNGGSTPPATAHVHRVNPFPVFSASPLNPHKK